MTSASHGFKTLRSRGIASKGDRRESLLVVARFWGAHAARVLAIASSRARTFSPTLLEPEPDGFGEPRALPRNDSDKFARAPTNWALRSFEDKFLPAAALAVADQIFFALRRRSAKKICSDRKSTRLKYSQN